MTGAITWEAIAYFAALATALLSLWYRVETQIAKSAVEAKKIAEQAQADANAAHKVLNEFKLHVADNYAKSSLIREVEERVIQRIDAVVNELTGMRKDFNDALMAMIRQSIPKD